MLLRAGMGKPKVQCLVDPGAFGREDTGLWL